MKRASWNTTKALYKIPFEIMQLEKDIKEKLEEVKKMRKRLSYLKRMEVKKWTKTAKK